ncbi:hypothetical protein [Profundibacter sp.]
MQDSLQEKTGQVAELMKTRLGIRGKDLATKLRHTGRMMPKRIKREAAFLVEAAALAKSPKLSRMIDFERVEAAHKTCMTFLESVDVADRRKGVVLGILGSLALSFVVVAGLVVTVLAWRGYI